MMGCDFYSEVLRESWFTALPNLPLWWSSHLGTGSSGPSEAFFVLFCFVFAVLGFELRVYTLSHSTSLFL
jgi:hypothetical protein